MTNMKSTISAQQVAAQLSGDIAACNTLLRLLDAEQTALAEKDAEALAAIIDQKLPALTQLEESAKQRALWSGAHDASDVAKSWSGVLDQINQEQLKADWEKVKTLTHECREKNAVNGKILARQQKVYGRLLEILRGQSATPNLYNAYGAATQSSRSIKVDEA